MTEGNREQTAASSRDLLEQDTEFYEAVTAVLAGMPPGSTVQEALRSPVGERARQKWVLKYGRQPPL